MKMFGEDYPTADGTSIRDYIHSADLVTAHILAAEHIHKTGESLQLNLGTGNGFTVKQVLDAVERAVGKPAPVEIGPRRPGDAVALYADTSKSKDILGWEPQHSDMDTIVSSAWNFHRKAWDLS